ncbi:MAG TPA: AMP-binding protein [Gemmatimonadaceae bacterium]|nr:AMP-binding protein [Gemmatimonadaceae bacterium]
MSDPLGLLPIAIAAGHGRVDGFETQQLVAAGLTLLQRSAPLVRALTRRRAGILLPTSPAFVTALAASEGRAAVLINPLAAAPEIEYQIADAAVGAVFTTSELERRLPPYVTRVLLDDIPRVARVVSDGMSRDVDLGSHFGLTLEGDADAPGSAEDAAIVYTSAMAGTALGARLTHANLLSNARATVEAGAMTRDDHALAVLPFSHLFGLVVSGVAPLLAGGAVTTMARFNPPRTIELLESEPISILVAVPAVFAGLAGLLGRRRTVLRSERLRLCICGGAPLAPEVQDRWFDLTGTELRQGYGLTEAGPVCLFNRVSLANRRGTLGVPLPGVGVSVRDPQSPAECPDETEGEICVAGPNVFAGYLNVARPPSHNEPWIAGLAREGEWLRTGDRGVRHADGTVSFRGVIKPMFTRNGFNIYPREIERVVMLMPGVRAARVRAIPEPIRENDIALEVDGDVTADEVKAWCEARLGSYKRPSEIVL